jgi:hypothetical protein
MQLLRCARCVSRVNIKTFWGKLGARFVRRTKVILRPLNMVNPMRFGWVKPVHQNVWSAQPGNNPTIDTMGVRIARWVHTKRWGRPGAKIVNIVRPENQGFHNSISTQSCLALEVILVPACPVQPINSKLQRPSILPMCGTPNVSPATMVIQLRVIAPIASDAWEKQRGKMGFVDVAIQVLVV